MESIDRRMDAEAEKREADKILAIELQNAHAELRKNLTHENIKAIFKANLNYFKRVRLGFENSWRHKMYTSGKNAANINKLKSRMISDPFSDIQQDQIYAEVKEIWLKSRAAQMRDNEYIELVLLPEVFLVMYQKYFILPTTEEADERISNVMGSIMPEDISPTTSILT